MKNKIKFCIKILMSSIFSIFPVKKNKIMCWNMLGKGYGDSPKYIVEELLKDHYDIVWAVCDNNEIFPEGIRKVEYRSLKYWYEMMTSKIWIDNARASTKGFKRKQQVYIQTWHGPTGFKKLENDAKDKLDPYFLKLSIRDGKMTDYMISSSLVQTKEFRDSFLFEGEILEVGLPRTDILIKEKNNTELVLKVKNSLGISENDKIVIYTPTFRDDGSTKGYIKDFEALQKLFEEKYGSTVLLVRMHPNVSDLLDDHLFNDKIINVSKMSDIQKLLLTSDFLITDYSTCALDFFLLNKPVFIYAYDYNEYEKLRGFRDLFFNLPVNINYSFDELCTDIRNFDSEIFQNKLCNFLEYYCPYDRGDAANRIADLVRNIIETQK